MVQAASNTRMSDGSSPSVPSKCLTLIKTIMENQVITICEWFLVVTLALLFVSGIVAVLLFGAWWHIITASGCAIVGLCIYENIRSKRD